MTNLFLDEMTSQVIDKMHKHMKFISIISIIMGIFYCLTIVGGVFGIPILLMGLKLKDSANNYNYYLQTKDENYLKEALERQAVYFKINFILLIIFIIMFILIIGLQILFISNLKNLFNSGYDLALINSFLEL